MEEKTFLDSADIRVTNFLVQTRSHTIPISDIKRVSIAYLWWFPLFSALMFFGMVSLWTGDPETTANAIKAQLQASGLGWLSELSWVVLGLKILMPLFTGGLLFVAHFYGYNVALHLKSRSRRLLLIDEIGEGAVGISLKEANFLKTIISAAMLEEAARLSD